MKTIAIILLIAGVLLLAAGIIIFFFTDCRKVFRDLTATRKMQAGGLDAAAQEIYYAGAMNYSSDDNAPVPDVSVRPSPAETAAKQGAPERQVKPVKKMFKRNTPHEAVDDTALLAAAKQEAAAKAEPAFTKSEAKEVSEKRLEGVDRTKPLIFQPSMQGTGTAPLTQNTPAGSGTEPLRKEQAGGTAPLNDKPPGTQPL